MYIKRNRHFQMKGIARPCCKAPHEIPVITAPCVLKWCLSSSLQHPSTDRHIPQITATFLEAMLDSTRRENPKCRVISSVTSLCSPTVCGYQKRLGRVESPSSGVAVALCAMEEECVCTAAGCDFSILKCREAAAAAAAAAWSFHPAHTPWAQLVCMLRVTYRMWTRPFTQGQQKKPPDYHWFNQAVRHETIIFRSHGRRISLTPF